MKRLALGIMLMTMAAGAIPAAAQEAMSPKAMEVKTAMRKLWEDHITYTRNAIISILADLKDQEAVVKRLMKNQEEIGNAIKPYYGEEAGNKLTTLLKEHISEAADVVKAAKSKNVVSLKGNQDKWKANARDIADFLADANPKWDRGKLKNMLLRHLDLTTGEVVSRLGRRWEQDINNYDNGHDHMLMFSDMLTQGIAEQFPDKFK